MRQVGREMGIEITLTGQDRGRCTEVHSHLFLRIKNILEGYVCVHFTVQTNYCNKRTHQYSQ